MPQRPASFRPVDVRGATRLASVAHRSKRELTRQARGYDQDWIALRDLFAASNPTCKHCDERGVAMPMSDVDHIIDIEIRPDLRLEWSNLQSLCKSCHGKKTRRTQNARK